MSTVGPIQVDILKSLTGTSGTSVNVQVKTPGGESPAVAADLFTTSPARSSQVGRHMSH
jgi:hypothetical protein